MAMSSPIPCRYTSRTRTQPNTRAAKQAQSDHGLTKTRTHCQTEMSPPIGLPTLPPLGVRVLALMPSILLVSLLLLLLFRGRNKQAEERGDATDSSTASKEETPEPHTLEHHPEEPASRPCKNKHVHWWGIGPWPFHETTLSIAHRPKQQRRSKQQRSDEEEEDDGSLLALLCQLNAEALTTLKVGVGEQGEWEGRANHRNVRVALITKDYRCSVIVVLGTKKYDAAEVRRSSMGRKS